MRMMIGDKIDTANPQEIDQLQAAVDAELLEDVGQMALDRGDGDKQMVLYIAIGFALDDQAQDLLLAPGDLDA